MSDSDDKPRHLRLVRSGEAAAAAIPVHDALAERILGALTGEGELLPADPALLRAALGTDAPTAKVATAVDTLLAEGVVRRLVVGREPHLALSVRARELPAPSKPADSDADFDLEVAVDVEHERVMLYRVLLVLLALGLVALAREWLLILLTH